MPGGKAMCFDGGDAPRVYEERHHKARKEHKCCECRLPIRPGERYLACFGVWDGTAETFKICEVCEWFRSRIIEIEEEAGCAGESFPPFGSVQSLMTDYGLIYVDRIKMAS